MRICNIFIEHILSSMNWATVSHHFWDKIAIYETNISAKEFMPIPQNALDLENRNIGMKGRKPQKDTVGEFKNRLKIVVFEFDFLRFYCSKMNSPTVSDCWNLPIFLRIKQVIHAAEIDTAR